MFKNITLVRFTGYYRCSQTMLVKNKKFKKFHNNKLDLECFCSALHSDQEHSRRHRKKWSSYCAKYFWYIHTFSLMQNIGETFDKAEKQQRCNTICHNHWMESKIVNIQRKNIGCYHNCK